MATPEHDPGRRAAAVRYRSGDVSPALIATERGHVADAILQAAADAGVPVREDPALLQALATLELGQHVPAELYAAVAEALVWAYRLTGRRPPG
jgi:flagellar biosynthesis protein